MHMEAQCTSRRGMFDVLNPDSANAGLTRDFFAVAIVNACMELHARTESPLGHTKRRIVTPFGLAK
jgi:hypothetical protein